MTKTISIGVGVVIIVGIGIVTYLQTRTSPDFESDGSGAANGTYTSAEVAKHADGSSCWTIINDSVYDLTSWIPEHPGGTRAILQLCGTDGSEKFNNQHGGKEPMMSILAGYKIGERAE